MISPEAFVFDAIADVLRVEYPGIFMSGESIDTPSKFPAVSIVEANNSVLRKMTTYDIENAATLMYEVNVYSNLIGYKKSQAKKIMSAIDDEFSRLGFTRIMCNPIDNLEDATIYRIVARYEGISDKDYMIYTS